MGYTQYYKMPRKPSAARWALFVADVQKIFAHPDVAPLVAFECDTPEMPPCADHEGVHFNGKGEDGHETCYLLPEKAGGFCKTNNKPYDAAVCAVLLAAHRHIGAVVSSDGDWAEWADGRAIYASACGHIAKRPWPEGEE